MYKGFCLFFPIYTNRSLKIRFYIALFYSLHKFKAITLNIVTFIMCHFGCLN